MLKTRIAAIAVVCFALVPPAFAQVDWSGPELGLEVGGAIGNDTGKGTCDPAVPCAGTITYGFTTAGPLGGAHAGYNFQFNQFVLGGEADIDGAYVNEGHTQTAFGAQYRFTSSNYWDASVRARLGYAFSNYLLYATGGVAFGDVDQTGFCPGCLLGGRFETWNTTRIGWTGGAGIDYAMTPNWSAGLEYRYTDLGSATFNCVACNDHDHASYTSDAIRLRITYRFASPPPAPAPIPVVAPAPPPPMMARTFLVFFDFDRYFLTPDARRVIEAAAETYKAGGHARIDVSGFTDLAGTQAYNLRLSQRRADAVAGYLEKQGVPRHVMDVKWFGKEHPRVPTPDGVREPQNRRVEIVMP